MDIFARRLEVLLKTSWRRFCKTSRRRFEDVWPRRKYWSWSRRLEEVFKMYSEDVWLVGICLEDALARHLEEILKTSWRRMAKTKILVLIKLSWRHLQDVFWGRLTWANIFVLIKTSSSEDEDERRLQDIFIKTNVCWEACSFSFFN